MGHTEHDTHEDKVGAGAMVVVACMAASLAALALWFSSAVHAGGEERLAGPNNRAVAVNGVVVTPMLAVK